MRQIGIQDKSMKKKTTVIQYGGGNFLRGFADYMIDVANEQGVFDGGIAIIKPTSGGSLSSFENQDSTYTVILRGLENGEKVVKSRIISSINEAINPFTHYDRYLNLAKNKDLRFVISNTTEAGIVCDETDLFDQKPASSFPGKLTQFLYERYIHFGGAKDCGLIILPTELIEDNGTKLQNCVNKLITLWNLPKTFATWINDNCIFCNSLVDRIVSGYPTDEAETLERDMLGYRDELLVVGEPFGLWVIESPRFKDVQQAFPLDSADMPVVFTDNLRPYRERKVYILNGAHTSTVFAAFLAGLDIVSEAMTDKTIRVFMEKAVYEEIAPTVPLPKDEVLNFANSVMERFENPFIKHALLSIALNSVSKWKTRILPSLKNSFATNGKLPACLTFSLATLATFYRNSTQGNGCLIGRRGDDVYEIRDDVNVLAFFTEYATSPTDKFIHAFLGNTDFWGEDLNALGDMTAYVTRYYDDIEKNGIRAAILAVLE